MVVQTHPISSALSLIGVMGSLAVLYLLLGGGVHRRGAGDRLRRRHHGAVRLRHHAAERGRGDARRRQVSMAQLARRAAAGRLPRADGLRRPAHAARNATACTFGGFTRRHRAGRSAARCSPTYLLPFEVTSILILIAILGAIVLARKEIGLDAALPQRSDFLVPDC